MIWVRTAKVLFKNEVLFSLNAKSARVEVKPNYYTTEFLGAPVLLTYGCYEAGELHFDKC